MKKYLFYLLVLTVTISCIACSQRRIFEKAISRTQLPLGYLHDSKYQSYSGARDSIFVTVHRNPLLPKTSVTRIGSTVVPLLIYNKNDVLLAGTLGQNSIEQSYAAFFRQKLGTEISRTNHFIVSDKVIKGYTLDISFENCSTVTNYRFIAEHIYLFFFLVDTYRAAGSPSFSSVKAIATLTKGDSLVFQKQYETSVQQEFLIPGDNKKFNNLTRNVQANMVESLSNASKAAITKIVNDVYREVQ